MYILPDALAPLGAWRQFILVRLVLRRAPDGQPIPGKTEKFPSWPHATPITNARGETVYQGGPWDAHDPACWMDWQTAAALAASMPVAGDTLGWCIGFVLTAADPFGCLDLDDCLQVDGTWSPAALAMLAALPGATEVSLSGRGLHQWIWYQPGQAPDHAKRRGGWEFYTELRFIALGHTASGAMLDVTQTLPAFVADHFSPLASGEWGDDWTTGPCADHTVLTDDEIIARGMAAERQQPPGAMFGAAPVLPCFRDLWTRDLSVLRAAYPTDQPGKEYDYSEADWALAKELAYWTGRDCARIERLMRQSALVRDKWDERRRNDTILTLTIKRGVGAQPRVHQARNAPITLPDVAPGTRLAPRVIEHDTYVHREGLAELFKECVYIQDRNEILLPNGDLVDQARFNARFGGYAFGMDPRGEKTSKSAWDAFLHNQVISFPRVEGTEFNPRLDYQQVIERGGREWVNVYRPPVIARRPGDVGPFLDLMHRILPNGDDALILLSYMAAVCQYPGVKFRWAPFIQGTRGNGKSTIVECLKHALGNKYVFTLKAGMIENGFNAWLENNILYVADDIYSTRDRTDMMEALKSLITGRDHAITLKGIDSVLKRICGNFIFMDNHKDSMKKQEDTRDLCTLYCAQQSRDDRKRDGLTKEYFAQFYAWLGAGGYEFVAEYLHTLDIDPRYNPAGECQEAPETSATPAAVLDGRTGLEQDVAELIELQEPGFAGNFVSYHMLKEWMIDKPQYRRPLSLLKAGELLTRLGYMQHPALPNGRTVDFVKPDNTRPVLFVRRDSMQAGLTDPAVIAALYVQAQNNAQAILTERKWK